MTRIPATDKEARTLDQQDLKAAIGELAHNLDTVNPADLRRLGVMLQQVRSIHDRAEEAGLVGVTLVTDGLRVLMEKMIVDEVPDQQLATRVLVKGISLLETVQTNNAQWTEQVDLWKASVASLGVLFHSLEPEAEQAPLSDPPGEAPQPLFDRALCQDFASEALEHLDQIEIYLIRLEQNPGDEECIDAVFRPFHNIKGVSGFLSLGQINRFAHEIESLLDGIRNNRLRVAPELIDFMLSAVDQMKAMILDLKGALETDSPLTPWDLAPYLEKIHDLEIRLNSEVLLQPQPIGEILVKSGRVTRDDVRTALDTQRTGSDNKRLGEILIERGKTEPRHVVDALRRQRTQLPAADPCSDRHEALRVDSAKLDRVGDLVAELANLQSRILPNHTAGAVQNPEVSRFTQITADLQKVVLSLRMVPIKEIFHRTVRLVRDFSKEGGKWVELSTEGGDLELDRNVAEVLYDPLVHMIRNAIDHGIELPEVRNKAGKAGHGRVSLKAHERDDQMVIEVRDDGQGLDRQSILKQAMEKGLVKRDDVLTDTQIDHLIFHPGLSTSEKVTLVSGRGVGMDIVKRAVEGLGGIVEIHSQPGCGTAFVILLPRTGPDRETAGSMVDPGRSHPDDKG